jgi:hypothetical protein
VQCGKENGAKEKVVLAAGYGYQLVLGSRHDGWKPPAGKSHAWLDREKVHFILTVPKGVAGVLRLHSVDGDGTNFSFRVQSVLVAGKVVAAQAVFHGPGVIQQVAIDSKETQDGKIDVVIKNERPELTAVISTVEFFSTGKAK